MKCQTTLLYFLRIIQVLFLLWIFSTELLHLCLLIHIPAWLQPADALTGHTAPSVSCAALLRGPTPAASHGETPAGPEPVWPCPHLCHITAPHLQKVGILFCYQQQRCLIYISECYFVLKHSVNDETQSVEGQNVHHYISLHSYNSSSHSGVAPYFALEKLFMEGMSREMIM